jgi:hypothetical protein
MHGSRLIGVLLFLLALGCLALTGWIIHLSGVMQGATETGQWALGLAAIAVHFSLAAFGLAMFVSRSLLVSIVCGVMMAGAAVCSAWQIATFLATEVISVTKAREQADKRETARTTAAIEMAKDRQKTQADLLKDELKWSRGTSREADGRRERKDLAETRAKMIAEVGKAELPVIPEAKTAAAPLQSGLVAQWLAARMGWDETAMQASPYLLIALMLLLMEVVLWPLSSYFWNRPTPVTEIGSPSAQDEPEKPLPSQAAQPAGLDAPGAPKALPAPDPEAPPPAVKSTPANPPAPQRPRQPVPGSVQALVDMGYPLTRPSGQLRPKEPPKDAARRFVTWARAMGLDGTYSATELSTLYREFAEADHREPIGYNPLASALGTTRGIERKRPKDATTSVWIIAPGKFRPKVQAAPKEAETAAQEPAAAPESDAVEEGRVLRGPFPGPAPASARAATHQTRPERGEPAWAHMRNKELRSLRITRKHKQRGSLTRAAC